MRIAFLGEGYRTAADALATGNDVLAVAAEILATRLAGCAGMAGDDATSHDFAAAYDESAGQALDTLADLTDAYGSLAVLLAASEGNHTAAEEASAGRPGTTRVEEPALSTFTPRALPSAAGGEPASPGDVKGWIVDQVEGFVWPSADVDALREAAAAWQYAAGIVADLPDYCRAAADRLQDQVSPEVPLALDALAELSDLATDVQAELAALAQSCEEYADRVEGARQAMHAVLEEIIAMLLEGVLFAGVLALLGGAVGLLGGATVVSGKIAAKAPKLHALAASLAASAGYSASSIRTAGQGLTHSQGQLSKFVRARARLRDERGSLGAGGGAIRRRFASLGERGWLRSHDAEGGHTLEKHVGKTNEYLMERHKKTDIPFSSTYTDEQTAERVIAEGIEHRADDVRRWLSDPTRKGGLEFDYPTSQDVGRCLDPDGRIHAPSQVRIVLRKDPHMPEGFRLLTSFPKP
ncbi:RNase A-like domain-containing protein [Nocardioides campestrisoli]|uniref:RNase A-like domain-containing protein n=1 Tax=Nocardioides campestrisoli TaxID=2736757 RepID=UPI0015E78B29|nr:RNase A-like domain-containing protein [Nocardioides campestrisoli]